jgi:hypothetical protein
MYLTFSICNFKTFNEIPLDHLDFLRESQVNSYQHTQTQDKEDLF